MESNTDEESQILRVEIQVQQATERIDIIFGRMYTLPCQALSIHHAAYRDDRWHLDVPFGSDGDLVGRFLKVEGFLSTGHIWTQIYEKDINLSTWLTDGKPHVQLDVRGYKMVQCPARDAVIEAVGRPAGARLEEWASAKDDKRGQNSGRLVILPLDKTSRDLAERLKKEDKTTPRLWSLLGMKWSLLWTRFRKRWLSD